MRVTTAQGTAALDAVAEEWDAIVARNGYGPAHLTDWLRTIFGLKARDRRLTITRVEASGEAVGFSAMVVADIRWNRLPMRQLTPLALLNQLHGSQFVVAHDHLRSVVFALVETAARSSETWDIWPMHLESGESQAFEFERALATLGLQYGTTAGEASPYLRLPADWEALQSGLQPRFRTSLRSREKAFRAAGEVQLQFYRSRADVPAALRAIEKIEARSWKVRSGLPITDSKHWTFYREYAELAAGAGRLVIAVLELNGEPLAFDYAVIDQGVYYLLQTSHTEDRKDLYPGFILRKLVIQWLIEQGAVEIDFGTGDTEWKSRWTRTVRRHTQYVVYGRSLRGRLVSAVADLKARRDRIDRVGHGTPHEP